MYPVSDQSTRRVTSPSSSSSAETYVQATNTPRSQSSQRPRRATSTTDRSGEVPRYAVNEGRQSRRTTLSDGRGTRSPEENGNGVRETRLVIGLDFGTTYTGVALATPRGTTCPLSEITVIKEWGHGMENLDKVPSVISYTKCSADYQQWGKSISPDAITMVHKKLELGPHSLQGELDLVVQVLEGMRNLNFEDIILANEDNMVPAYACKSPEEIVTDYLTKIFTYLDQSVDQFSEAFRRYTATDVVVTIPTHWPYEALNSTYRAVTTAGFSRVNFPKLNDILFVTESEAAARYTVRHYKEEKASDFLHENSYFVLCDAGGGTVDVVSYKVTKSRPTLQLQQIGRPTGAKCGSVFINQKFKRWLRRKIGDHHYRSLDPELNMDKTASHASEHPAMRELMEAFDARKERFTALDDRDIRIDLPPPLDNIHVPGVVSAGVLTITRERMESFFDDCLLQIVRLIREHMKQIENVASGKAKNLFLVGGFGSSDYLRHHIEATMSEYRIRFRTPDTSWTAIVQGAVVCGIDNAQIQSVRRARACPCSYGVSMDEVFQETNHARDDLIEEPDGQMYAKAQLIWLLNEGDVLIANEPRKVRKEFDISFLKTQSHVDLPIYQHSLQHGEDQEDRPDRLKTAMDEISQATALRVDLADLRALVSGRGFRESLYKEARAGYHPSLKLMEGAFFSTLKSQYRVTLVLELERTWDSLQASVSWGKHELAKVTA